MRLCKAEFWIIFLVTFTFYGYFVKQGDWNINSRLGLVKAVVEEHRLAIDSYHTGEFETEDKAFIDGHYYSDKAFGTSALGAIIYGAIHPFTGNITSYSSFVMLMTILTISFPTALLAPVIYGLSVKYTKNRWFSLAITLSICLGTAVFPYASAFYGHALSALTAFSAFSLWIDINLFNAKLTANKSFLGGLLIGLLVITEYPTAIIALILTGYIGYVAWKNNVLFSRNFLIPFLAGGGIILMLLLTYNKMVFGSPFTTGYSFNRFETFEEAFSRGYMGFEWPRANTLFLMTLHPTQGIFLQSPVLLIALASTFWTIKKKIKILKAEVITASAVIMAFLIAFSGVRLWWGGDAFSTRYVVAILPFFTIFLLEMPKTWRLPFYSLGIISFFQMLIASATTFNGLDLATKKIVETGGYFSSQSFSLYTILLPRLLKNKLTLTLGNHLLGIESWYFNLAIPVIIALALLMIFYITDRQPLTSRSNQA